MDRFHTPCALVSWPWKIAKVTTQGVPISALDHTPGEHDMLITLALANPLLSGRLPPMGNSSAVQAIP